MSRERSFSERWQDGDVIACAVVPLVVLAGFAVLFRSRILSWAEGNGWIFPRDPATGKRGQGSGSGGVLAAVDYLFAPSKQHVAEEQAGSRVRRALTATGEGVDLDNNAVHLTHRDD